MISPSLIINASFRITSLTNDITYKQNSITRANHWRHSRTVLVQWLTAQWPGIQWNNSLTHVALASTLSQQMGTRNVRENKGSSLIIDQTI